MYIQSINRLIFIVLVSSAIFENVISAKKKSKKSNYPTNDHSFYYDGSSDTSSELSTAAAGNPQVGYADDNSNVAFTYVNHYNTNLQQRPENEHVAPSMFLSSPPKHSETYGADFHTLGETVFRPSTDIPLLTPASAEYSGESTDQTSLESNYWHGLPQMDTENKHYRPGYENEVRSSTMKDKHHQHQRPPKKLININSFVKNTEDDIDNNDSYSNKNEAYSRPPKTFNFQSELEKIPSVTSYDFRSTEQDFQNSKPIRHRAPETERFKGFGNYNSGIKFDDSNIVPVKSDFFGKHSDDLKFHGSKNIYNYAPLWTTERIPVHKEKSPFGHENAGILAESNTDSFKHYMVTEYDGKGKPKGVKPFSEYAKPYLESYKQTLSYKDIPKNQLSSPVPKFKFGEDFYNLNKHTESYVPHKQEHSSLIVDSPDHSDFKNQYAAAFNYNEDIMEQWRKLNPHFYNSFKQYNHYDISSSGSKNSYSSKVPTGMPHPVLVPVPHPWPVRVPVAKPFPVPVVRELRVPVEKAVPYPVVKKVPYRVDKLVPVPIEKEVAVPVAKPYPVPIPHVRPVFHHSRHLRDEHRHFKDTELDLENPFDLDPMITEDRDYFYRENVNTKPYRYAGRYGYGVYGTTKGHSDKYLDPSERMLHARRTRTRRSRRPRRIHQERNFSSKKRMVPHRNRIFNDIPLHEYGRKKRPTHPASIYDHDHLDYFDPHHDNNFY